MISYGKQSINQDDIDAVTEVLSSDFLTQGPKVREFEQAIEKACAVPHACAVANGTAALQMACAALQLTAHDEVWTSANSFVASANCALCFGAKVDFIDIDQATRNICPGKLAEKLVTAEREGRLPKIVIVVHFAGLCCDMAAISALSEKYGFSIIEDAAHAIGSHYYDRPVGSCQYSSITTFSFHPVKNITCGEGGAATTKDPDILLRMQAFRSHGITKDKNYFCETTSLGLGKDDGEIPEWYYEQQSLGHNLRLSDIHSALGISQLKRLPDFVAKRQELFDYYNDVLSDLDIVLPSVERKEVVAWHLYCVELKRPARRDSVFKYMRDKQIGVNVHYIPIPRQPYYKALGFNLEAYPAADAFFQGAITLPCHPSLTQEQLAHVSKCLREALE